MRAKTRKSKSAKKRTKTSNAARVGASSGRAKTAKAKKAKSPARSKSKSRTLSRKGSARKASASKVGKKRLRSSQPRRRKEAFGEGNDSASREFREDETKFVQRNRDRIPAMGEEAKQALEGDEHEALEAAEERARSHSHSPGQEI